jgi:hypothetical protein
VGVSEDLGLMLLIFLRKNLLPAAERSLFFRPGSILARTVSALNIASPPADDVHQAAA